MILQNCRFPGLLLVQIIIAGSDPRLLCHNSFSIKGTSFAARKAVHFIKRGRVKRSERNTVALAEEETIQENVHFLADVSVLYRS